MRKNIFWYYYSTVLFILSLGTFTLSVFQKRHFFNLEALLASTGYIEWLSISFFISDYALVALLALSVPFFIFKAKKHDNPLLSLFLGLSLISLASIIGLDQFPSQIGLFRALKLISLLGYTYVFSHILSSKARLIVLLAVISSMAAMQSVWAIAQFSLQSSLGITFLAETPLSPLYTNIAEIVERGTQLIRPTGSFPHSNVLGFFLVFGFIATLILNNLLARETKSLKHVFKVLPNVSLKINNYPHIPQVFNTLFTLFGMIISIGIVFTFSRTAYISFAATLIIVCIYAIKHEKMQALKNKHLIGYILATLTATAILLPLIAPRGTISNANGDRALSIREEGISQGVEQISKSPFLGTGIGTNVINQLEENPDKEIWQYQPIHNSPILIISEIGILGFFIIFALLVYLASRASKTESSLAPYSLSILLVLILTLTTDHHIWTTHQSMHVFWTAIIIILTLSKLTVSRETRIN